MDIPLGDPRKGEQKGGRLKTQREEVPRRTGLVVSFSHSCTALKDTKLTAELSKNTLAEAEKRNLLR